MGIPKKTCGAGYYLYDPGVYMKMCVTEDECLSRYNGVIDGKNCLNCPKNC